MINKMGFNEFGLPEPLDSRVEVFQTQALLPPCTMVYSLCTNTIIIYVYTLLQNLFSRIVVASQSGFFLSFVFFFQLLFLLFDEERPLSTHEDRVVSYRNQKNKFEIIAWFFVLEVMVTEFAQVMISKDIALRSSIFCYPFTCIYFRLQKLNSVLGQGNRLI